MTDSSLDIAQGVVLAAHGLLAIAYALQVLIEWRVNSAQKDYERMSAFFTGVCFCC
jgi:hypothetical protein